MEAANLQSQCIGELVDYQPDHQVRIEVRA
jgi:hypothetical protein